MALLMLDVLAAHLFANRPAQLVGSPNSLGCEKGRHPGRTLPQQRRHKGLLRHPGCVPHAIQRIAKIPEYSRIDFARKQRLLQRFQLDNRPPQPLCNSRT